jgi:hypothetical protein
VEIQLGHRKYYVLAHALFDLCRCSTGGVAYVNDYIFWSEEKFTSDTLLFSDHHHLGLSPGVRLQSFWSSIVHSYEFNRNVLLFTQPRLVCENRTRRAKDMLSDCKSIGFTVFGIAMAEGESIFETDRELKTTVSRF